MKQVINFITIGVKDLSKMRKFYTDVFGWELMDNRESIAFFTMNSFILSLYDEKELADDIGIEFTSSNFKRVALAINFSSEKEVDSEFSKLISKGAKAIKNPEKASWGGYRGYIADIENNYWEIAYNPFIELNEDGTFKNKFT